MPRCREYIDRYSIDPPSRIRKCSFCRGCPLCASAKSSSSPASRAHRSGCSPIHHHHKARCPCSQKDKHGEQKASMQMEQLLKQPNVPLAQDPSGIPEVPLTTVICVAMIPARVTSEQELIAEKYISR